MDDLSAEFAECIEANLHEPEPSAFARLALLCGPPEGVDFYEEGVWSVMRLLSERFPNLPVHDDWRDLWAGVTE